MKRTMRTLLIACCVAVGCAAVAVAGSSPTVSTGSATKIGDTGATLGGSVNPQGTKTTYRFEYGLTNLYGELTKDKSAGSGAKAVAVTAGIGSLIPGTIYHYKLLAINRYGTGTGTDRTFKTAGHAPPVAGTGPVIAIHQSSATLTGSVNPNGEATSWRFQYGPTAFYGSYTTPQTLPASDTASLVSVTLTQLEPGVTFHYRLVALHGTTVVSTGQDATFFTLPDPAPKPKVRATTTPKKAKKQPFMLTTNGSVTGPSSIPTANSCFGSATLIYSVGKHRVGIATANLLGNCTFSATKKFRKYPVRRKKHQKTEALKVQVHFRGNGYLAPAFSSTQTVTLG